MTSIPLATSDWRRGTAEEPVVKVQNRFFEQNPTNLVEGSSLILRPGLRSFATIPDYVPLFPNKIRGLYFNESLFNNNIFVIAATSVHKISPYGTQELLTRFATNITHNNQGTFTSPIEGVPGFFYFINDLGNFYVTAETTFATSTLVATGAPEEGATVRVGSMYYKFTSGDLDTGTPAGTSSNPWLVRRSGTSGSLINLGYALAADSFSFGGVRYSRTTLGNPSATFGDDDLGEIKVRARIGGAGGNGVPTTVSATSVLSWTRSALSFGGESDLFQQDKTFHMQTQLGRLTAIGTINSYVLLASGGTNVPSTGRFYWIEPGETTVDLLNFATTEMSPDSLVSMRMVGEFIWFLGRQTTEVWTSTGNNEAPFVRARGQSMNIGAYKGSDQVIDRSLVFAGTDYKIRVVSGTSVDIISTNSEEELLRKFIQTNSQVEGNPIKSWTTSVDGHIFYGLTLGTERTLVYDMTTQTWATWVFENDDYFRPVASIPAVVPITNFPGTFLPLMGDSESGKIWFVDPDRTYDELSDDPNEVTLIRSAVTAGIPMRLRDSLPCNEVYLTASVGSPILEPVTLIDPDGAELLDPDGVTLVEYMKKFDPDVAYPNAVGHEYSDDNGKTWVTASPVLLRQGDYNQEIVWRSMGSIGAPGRVFRFYDYSGLKRIDGLDVR